MTVVLVAIGSALGGAARAAVSVAATRRIGAAFPWGTLVVNVAGTFLLGLSVSLLPAGEGAGIAPLAALLGAGFCGGFTTLSSFSLQSVTLLAEGRYLAVAGNALANLVLCLGSGALGFAIGGLAR